VKRDEFSSKTKEAALKRQDNRCASCGVWIRKPERGGIGWVPVFGEWTRAHHVVPAVSGGDASVANCVIICQACHYSAHGGGAYKKSKAIWMKGRSSDYPRYNGIKVPNSEGARLAQEMDDRFGRPLKSLK
jgi:hypothetical protein